MIVYLVSELTKNHLESLSKFGKVIEHKTNKHINSLHVNNLLENIMKGKKSHLSAKKINYLRLNKSCARSIK